MQIVFSKIHIQLHGRAWYKAPDMTSRAIFSAARRWPGSKLGVFHHTNLSPQSGHRETLLATLPRQFLSWAQHIRHTLACLSPQHWTLVCPHSPGAHDLALVSWQWNRTTHPVLSSAHNTHDFLRSLVPKIPEAPTCENFSWEGEKPHFVSGTSPSSVTEVQTKFEQRENLAASGSWGGASGFYQMSGTGRWEGLDPSGIETINISPLPSAPSFVFSD